MHAEIVTINNETIADKKNPPTQELSYELLIMRIIFSLSWLLVLSCSIDN